jgi:protein TonB
MSRLSVLSWLTSGLVHTLAFALLGTLLTQVAAERPDFFVPRGTLNASFSSPRRTVATESEPAVPNELADVPLPLPASVKDERTPDEERLPSEDEPDQDAKAERESVELTAAEEEPLPTSELLAISNLAVQSVALQRRPGTSPRRRPSAPPAVSRTQAAARRPETLPTMVSQVSVEKSTERQPEPQLKIVEARPPQRQPREIDTPPVTTADENETEARQQEVAGSSQSRPPRPLRNAPPEYPRAAIRRRLEGTVKLRIHVGLNGQVMSVAVAQSSGYPLLDQSALDALRDWKFSPRLRDGEPVESTEVIPVRFHLN